MYSDYTTLASQSPYARMTKNEICQPFLSVLYFCSMSESEVIIVLLGGAV